MQKKNYLWSVLAILMVALMSVGLSSCGDDDGGDSVPTNLVGTWRGTNGTWEFSFTFNSNKTCSGSAFSKRGSQYRWEYTYTCSGNKVRCKGVSVYAGFDGEVTENKNCDDTFVISGTTMTGGPFSGVTYYKD